MNAQSRSTYIAVATTFGLVLAAAPAVTAQTPITSRSSWEVLMASGALIPTGAERSAIKDAPLSAMQVSYVMRSRFAVTTTLGWARSRDLGSIDAPKLDVFTYDLGAEARAPRWRANESVAFTPFIGIGAGGRSYNHRSLDVDATHNVAGYTAAGGELGVGRVHLRLELRDYVSGFKPLGGGGTSAARNDVIAMLGLRFTKRGA